MAEERIEVGALARDVSVQVATQVANTVAAAKTNELLSASASAEASRVSAEQGRVTAEQGRVTAEQGRVAAEEARATEFAGFLPSLAKPAGIYDTVAELTTAYPSGNGNVYVIRADNKWYTWSGSAWVAGGDYKGLAEIGRSELNDDLKAKTDTASQDNENLQIVESNLFSTHSPVLNTTETLETGKACQLTGTDYNIPIIATGDSTYKLLTVDNVVPGLVKITCSAKQSRPYGAGFVCVKANNYTEYVYYYDSVSNGSGVKREVYYNIPANVKKIYVNARYDVTPSLEYVNKTFYDKDEINLLTKKGTFAIDFTPIAGAYISALSTKIVFNENGSSSKPIRVLKGDIIHWTAAGYENQVAMIATCNEDYTNISVKVQSSGNTVSEYTYTATDDCYVVVSYINTLSHSLTIERPSNGSAPAQTENYIDLSLFKNFGVVGDSYASGALYYDSSYNDTYPISWPQIMARGLGTDCINFTKGGLTTRSWLTNTTYGLSLMQSSPAQDIYYLCLGINDYFSLGQSYLGSISDITSHSDYHDYADTFYGNYGRIIEQILEHAPYAKIIMFTMAENTGVAASFNSAIVAIANHYNIPYIVQSNHPYFSTTQYLDMVGGHPRALGYAGMAKAFKELIEDCIKNNYNYFKDLFMHS